MKEILPLSSLGEIASVRRISGVGGGQLSPGCEGGERESEQLQFKGLL